MVHLNLFTFSPALILSCTWSVFQNMFSVCHSPRASYVEYMDYASLKLCPKIFFESNRYIIYRIYSGLLSVGSTNTLLFGF